MPEIKIYQGDAIETMAKLASSSVDMVFADLPYGTTYAPWDCLIPMDALWEQWLRVCKPNAAIVLTASQPFTSALVMSKPKLFRCEWIWDKVNGANFANSKRQPLKTHESVLVFATGQTMYNPQMTQGKPNHTQGKNAKDRSCETQLISVRAEDDLSGLKYPKSIQVFPKHSSQSKLHPTQKPVPLVEYFLRTYSNEGDTVLDCTAGSGTTGEAAWCSNRNAILIDNNPKYIQTMIDRLPYATVISDIEVDPKW